MTGRSAAARAENLSNGTNSAGQITVNFTTPDTNDFDNVVPNLVTFNITAASGEVGFAESSGSTINFVAPSGETNVKYAYTSQGAKIKWEDPTSDPDNLNT
ncbi:hypothetical protein HYU13_01995 [Candidatus Woesearchaeota archaeon]|nr:hypothetical protein [Candidatus Woesearchaeota archaeon]